MIGLITLGIFIVVSCAVGMRLLWTAAHGGGATAWTCGIGFAAIGMFGYPLATLSGFGTLPVGQVNHGLAAAGTVFMTVGLSSFFAFTLLAFRRRDAWAWALTALGVGLLAVAAFGQIGALAKADPTMPSAEAAIGWTTWTLVLSTFCYAWSGFEGLSEWVRARRRVALGITDPLVANRIFLWGIHGAAVTCLNVLLMTLRYHSVNLADSLLAQVPMAIMAVVSTATISLAFFPTRSWESWVRGRARAEA